MRSTPHKRNVSVYYYMHSIGCMSSAFHGFRSRNCSLHNRETLCLLRIFAIMKKNHRISKHGGRYRMAATMKDIARMTGLGLATISKYLNGGKVRPKNKKLIEDAVRDAALRAQRVRAQPENQPEPYGRRGDPGAWQPVHHLHYHHHGGYPAQARLRGHRLRLPHQRPAARRKPSPS